MSLINDALKRARQAQTQTPPTTLPPPQLRPVEQAPNNRRSFGVILPIVLLIIAGIGLLLAWSRFHAGAGSETQDIAAAKRAAIPAPTSPSEATRVRTPKAISSQSVSTEQAVPVVFGPPSGGHSDISESKSSLPENVKIDVSSERVVAAASPLKLTGIVFHPTHPAAMIGGKTLFLNDKLGDWQVVAINRESATLSNAGQTNVLSLSK